MTPDGVDSAVPESILNQMQSREVLYFPPATVERAPNVNDSDIKEAFGFIQQSGAQIDDMLNTERLTRLKMKDLPNIFYTYLNRKVDTGLQNLGSDFVTWMNTSKVSPAKQERIQQYISEHQNAFSAMWQLVTMVMNVKDNIINQFDSHNTAIKAHINGQDGGEGYVLDHADGAIKLVNRAGFTAANRAVQRESKDINQIKRLSGL